MTIGRAFIVNPSWWFDWLLIQKAKECIKNNVFFFVNSHSNVAWKERLRVWKWVKRCPTVVCECVWRKSG